MSRYPKIPRTKPPPEPQPPYPCFFGCGMNLETKFDRTAIEGWEWFTGYGDHPIHFCPKCRSSRQSEINRIREKLNVRPENYPLKKAKL